MKTFPLLLSLTSIIALPALSDVVLVNDNGFILANTARANAPQERVYQALIEDVDNWWPKDHSWWRGTFSIDPVGGGCFCEIKGAHQAQHMDIAFVDPPSTLVMRGGLGPLQQMGVSGALTWSLTEQTDDGGTYTTITLRYHAQGITEGGFTDFAPIVDKVQALQLNALAEYASNHASATTD
ncbi:SRPBCC domain-containing protein [Alteromonas sp. CYL-A6]|uniref:SRPBCC domain-containing protein n=1 Tax=Alteromonas nitratireducens TaxID=3390813 RepID=UPI0034A7639D